MVIAVSAGGSFSQELHPAPHRGRFHPGLCRDRMGAARPAAGREHYVFYLGSPGRLASPGRPGRAEPKSLSVQVVGTSPMTGREDYSGGVDVTLQAQVALPLVPGFLSLAERFFPTLCRSSTRSRTGSRGGCSTGSTSATTSASCSSPSTGRPGAGRGR